MKHNFPFFLKTLSLTIFLSFSCFTHSSERKRIKQADSSNALSGSFYNEETKKYNCNFCTRKTPRKPYMVAHLLTHSNKRPWPCSFCTMTFKRNDIARRHMNNVHLKIREHPCTTCKRSFKRADHLKAHIITHRLTASKKTRPKKNYFYDDSDDDDEIPNDSTDHSKVATIKDNDDDVTITDYSESDEDKDDEKTALIKVSDSDDTDNENTTSVEASSDTTHLLKWSEIEMLFDEY